MKVTVLWDVASCSFVEIDRRFRGAYCLHHLIALMMEAASTSETSVNIPEDSHLYIAAVRTWNLTYVLSVRQQMWLKCDGVTHVHLLPRFRMPGALSLPPVTPSCYGTLTRYFFEIWGFHYNESSYFVLQGCDTVCSLVCGYRLLGSACSTNLLHWRWKLHVPSYTLRWKQNVPPKRR
jgi:hypothetical protein